MKRSSRLLELDPDLGAAMEPARHRRATADLVVRLHGIEPGPWRPSEADPWAPAGALLLTDGCLLRQVSLEHRAGAEILGPGDLLRPWQGQLEHRAYPYESCYEAVQNVVVAELDLALLARLAAYPEITSDLFGRALERSRQLVGHLVLAQLASVEHRLLLGLWHLADRWGRVGVQGTSLPLPLTHRSLGLLIGARRPSVTSALVSLAAQELVLPRPEGGFLLCGDPPQGLTLARGASATGGRHRAN